MEQKTDDATGPTDFLHVHYDPAKVSPKALLQVVDKHEPKFTAKIVPAP